MLILINEVRNKLAVNIPALVKTTGISRATLYRYEDQEKSPPIDNLELIAKAMGVGIEDLYESPYKHAKKEWDEGCSEPQSQL